MSKAAQLPSGMREPLLHQRRRRRDRLVRHRRGKDKEPDIGRLTAGIDIACRAAASARSIWSSPSQTRRAATPTCPSIQPEGCSRRASISVDGRIRSGSADPVPKMLIALKGGIARTSVHSSDPPHCGRLSLKPKPRYRCEFVAAILRCACRCQKPLPTFGRPCTGRICAAGLRVAEGRGLTREPVTGARLSSRAAPRRARSL